MALFLGRYYHTIDEKGRIIFPAKLREIFEERYDNHLVITGWDDYLLVLPHAEWKVIEEKLSQQSIIRKEVRAFQRLFMSGAVDCIFDGQGRILIPPSLRSYAGLDKDIVTAGMGKSIEIWDRKKFDEELIRTNQNTEEYSDYVANLGI